jgi:hypothetical protein
MISAMLWAYRLYLGFICWVPVIDSEKNTPAPQNILMFSQSLQQFDSLKLNETSKLKDMENTKPVSAADVQRFETPSSNASLEQRPPYMFSMDKSNFSPVQQGMVPAYAKLHNTQSYGPPIPQNPQLNPAARASPYSTLPPPSFPNYQGYRQ